MKSEVSEYYVGPGGLLLKKEEQFFRALKWVVVESNEFELTIIELK
ncbi:hypothetical protein [Persicobacter psychrovividus]|uniref:Uncharacterized protein n=1 Tax=Persicobacter psychrovividus TaxID=387638 RepID=A0ABN6L805_9BACT|nr:hypothetical protein PEPS_15860 [Persicobacter psychrovividus]